MSPPVCPPIHHDRLMLERVYVASPAQVFDACSVLEHKRQWFGCSEGIEVLESHMDFREGGSEFWRGRHAAPDNSWVEFRNETRIHHVAPQARIVISYTMFINSEALSTSLMTVEMQAQDRGTHLKLTEHIAVLNGSNDTCVRMRIQGTDMLLDLLAAYLEHKH